MVNVTHRLVDIQVVDVIDPTDTLNLPQTYMVFLNEFCLKYHNLLTVIVLLKDRSVRFGVHVLILMVLGWLLDDIIIYIIYSNVSINNSHMIDVA